MNYLTIALVVALALGGLKAWNGWKAEAKERGVAVAEKQIADGLLRNEREDADVLRKQIEERDARIAAMTANQKARATNETKQRTTNPPYGTWANTPVPQFVTDELRNAAGANGGVRASTSDKQSETVVQPQSATAAGKDGQRPATALRLGPARRD